MGKRKRHNISINNNVWSHLQMVSIREDKPISRILEELAKKGMKNG